MTRSLRVLLRRFGRATGGAALAEFALVLPFLVILMGASIEATRVIYQYHVIAKSVQDAARFLSRREEVRDSGNCPPGASWATAETLARNLALTGSINARTGYILPHWTDPGTIAITVSCQASAGMVSPVGGGIPIIEVSASVPFNDVGLIGFLGLDDFSIGASHREIGVGG